MFAHLHCHFSGSYSDGLLDPERDLEFVRGLGQQAVALTDHGVIDCAYPFYRACRRVGLNPVIGCEVYFVADAAASIARGDPYRNHLILLARDNAGYSNLLRLVNASWLENNFGEARGLVDWPLLEKYHSGLIALSACFWGSLPQKYLTGGPAAAEAEFRRYYDIFGRDFHPELGRHGIPDEEKANAGLIELSRRFGTSPVVTNDVHYRLPEDWRIHDILIKTRCGKAADFSLDSREYWLKSEAQMLALGFPPEYCAVSAEIADSCRVDLDALPLDLEIETPATAEETVLAARPVVIDAAQAIRDLAGAWKIAKSELADLFPEGSDPDASRARWLERHPGAREAVEKLEGITRRIGPDWETAIPVPLKQLRERLPLRRAGGAVIVSTPRGVLESLSVPISPVSALIDAVPGLRRRTAALSARQTAREKLAAGEPAAAAVLLEGILQSGPDDPEVRLSLADAYYSLRRYRPAVEQYEALEAGGLSPRLLVSALVRQGWSWNWLEEPERARAAFARARVLNPDYAPALYGLGMVGRRQGKTAEAVECLRDFLRLRPDGRQAEKARSVLARLER